MFVRICCVLWCCVVDELRYITGGNVNISFCTFLNNVVDSIVTFAALSLVVDRALITQSVFMGNEYVGSFTQRVYVDIFSFFFFNRVAAQTAFGAAIFSASRELTVETSTFRSNRISHNVLKHIRMCEMIILSILTGVWDSGCRCGTVHPRRQNCHL